MVDAPLLRDAAERDERIAAGELEGEPQAHRRAEKPHQRTQITVRADAA